MNNDYGKIPCHKGSKNILINNKMYFKYIKKFFKPVFTAFR